MCLSKLIVLVGLPASGKSTLAKELKLKYKAHILSSDKIRKGLFNDVNNQDDNVKVFDTLYKQARNLLSLGENVIIDSTNINRKRRIHLINNELKADEYIVYYMNKSMGSCLYNDDNRDRKVGYKVIDKMCKNMHVPTKLEGWDKVNFVNSYFKYEDYDRVAVEKILTSDHDYEFLFEELSKFIVDFRDIYELPHDSSYHSFSVSRHTYHVHDYVRKNYKCNKLLEMLYASLFHDLGKGHCKTFFNHKGEERRYANFIGHENVSAQLACNYLSQLGYGDDFTKYVVDLIQFHMLPINMSSKTEKRLRSLLTEEQYDDLMFLHEADLQAK